ncbi:ABC transporter permease [Halomarina salina]|uniref:ABC transporter permease n=1 Tax=Halomarina salina TaxID=1872699 RepID=A0ABD5RNX7_9EURY|nr:ABC transporter permease subunit [Halomarina salina]
MSTSSSRFRFDGDVVLFGRLAVPLVVVALWQVLAMSVSGFALATPTDTFDALLDGIRSGWMVEGFERTMTELLVAYVLAIVVGIWAGVALGLSDFWHDVFEPIVLGTYAIPKVTLFPIFLFVFQFGMDSKIAFGWFHGVFPVAILTMSAMGTIDETHLDVARSLRLSRWQTFRHVIVPSILPGLVIGLRLGFNLTFLGIVLGEMFASRAGLGYTLVEYIAGVQTAPMLAIIVVLVLVATVVNVGFFVLENRLGSRSADTAQMA